MCYNIQTSIVSFVVVTTCGIIALRLKQPILGCLMLTYGLMQLSEVIIWRGVNTNNNSLNLHFAKAKDLGCKFSAFNQSPKT